MSEKTFENVPVSPLSHIVLSLSLILQADCQRRLRAHPWGHGSAEGPGCHQPVTVRRQLPERRQPDPPSARPNQVRREVKGEESHPQRVTLKFPCLWWQLVTQRADTRAPRQNKHCQVALMEPQHAGQTQRAESLWHENSCFSLSLIYSA